MKTLKASPAMTAARDARTEVTPAITPASNRAAHERIVRRAEKGGRVDPAQLAEARAAVERLDRLAAIAKLQGRVALDTGQAFTLMQLGAELRLGRIKDLAPTPQIAKWCRDYGDVKAWLNRKQVAALAWYHGLHLMTLVGRGCVDPADIRVDGGGGGAGLEFALANAMDASRALRRVKAALPVYDRKPLYAHILDWVVINDREIDGFKIGDIYPITGAKSQAAARRLIFVQASTYLSEQIPG